MNDSLWRDFFRACVKVLGPGSRSDYVSSSWCAWTTFDRLGIDAGYWTSGVPDESHIGETHITDSSPAWGQPFGYAQLAHVIIPAQFFWEHREDGQYTCGFKHQSIAELSEQLTTASIPHRLTELLLEIKLY